MQPPPDISIIISTYNRGDSLRETLNSLLSQDAAGVRYEIIVVDNNSTDDTAAVIQSYVADGDNVRYVFEPQQGVPHGRNAGLRAARAPIVAFTDDDVVVLPGWLQAIRRGFDENPDVDYLTGRMLPIYEAPPPRWLTAETSGPCVLRDRGDRPIHAEAGCFFPGWATANIAFRRRVFERVGVFDGAFPRGEDLEFIIRAWRAGCRGMYAPDLSVRHHVTADRLTKAYHRRWHATEGNIRARVRFREIFDQNNRVIDGEPQVRCLFGVPRFLYRELLAGAARWAMALLRGDAARAFGLEGQLRQTAHYALTCFRRERPPLAVPTPLRTTTKPSASFSES